jgi:hypothetical protein
MSSDDTTRDRTDEQAGQSRPKAEGGGSDEEQREVMRGDQGTSSGNPHDDSDPQSGS